MSAYVQYMWQKEHKEQKWRKPTNQINLKAKHHGVTRTTSPRSLLKREILVYSTQKWTGWPGSCAIWRRIENIQPLFCSIKASPAKNNTLRPLQKVCVHISSFFSFAHTESYILHDTTSDCLTGGNLSPLITTGCEQRNISVYISFRECIVHPYTCMLCGDLLLSSRNSGRGEITQTIAACKTFCTAWLSEVSFFSKGGRAIQRCKPS